MDELMRELNSLRDERYAAFHSGLLPGVTGITGVRVPELRKIARRIAGSSRWEEFVRGAVSDCYEINMLRGMVLGYVRTDIDKLLELLALWVPQIDNWAVCDCSCATLKAVRRHPERTWEFLQPYLHSAAEFEARFGAVMLLNHFSREPYTRRTLAALKQVRHTGYYARMGVAWALSVLYVRDRQMILDYLADGGCDPAMRSMTVRKILDSRRTPAEDRELLRALGRGSGG